tara:strand:- start:294 stop:686 length:393 start_codon:yes stop_codon:yes gene_type:complete
MYQTKGAPMSDTLAIAQRYFQAYENSDRDVIERLVSDDFRFTSPLDNQLDRNAYFECCWPNHQRIDRFDLIHLVANGDDVFVTYEGDINTGRRFRNTEILTIRDGRVTSVEVYFGWNLPHDVPEGSSAPS